MNPNSKAIVILCSHLCVGENIKPYEPMEWMRFADRLIGEGIEPHEVLSFSDEDFKSKLSFTSDEARRIRRLVERSGSIAFEIERYASMGIFVLTRADNNYPKVLKRKLGKSCPPLFYFAGDPSLTEKQCVGFVGSRSIENHDADFTVKTVEKCISNGLAVVSGGAKGVDSVAQAASLENGSSCIAYVADSLVRRIKEKSTMNAVLEGRFLILSVAKPDAGFSAGMAMMRNKYIYSQSAGTVIVKSEYNKGGTWSGAIDNLNNQRCVTFCRNYHEYRGNIELINRGAIPIDEKWDADVSAYSIVKEPSRSPEQLSMFAV